MATVIITAAAQEQFLGLPRVIQARMERIFVRLEQWPAKKVAGTLDVGLSRVYLAKHRVGRRLRKEIKTLQKQIC